MTDDHSAIEQWQETSQARIDEFWELMKAELAKDPPPALTGVVIEGDVESTDVVPIETQEVVVREIPTAAENAANAVLAANLREELEDMWNTRRENPDEFYENLDDSRATLERLIKKHNKKTGYVEPQPKTPTRQQQRDEAMVETSQYPRLDALFKP